MGDLNGWVKGQLFDVLGFAEKNTIGYVVSLAKKAKSEQDLASSLAALDVPNNAKTRRFVGDLYNRVPRGAAAPKAGPTASQQRERKARELAAKNTQFGLLRDPEPAGRDKSAAKRERKMERKLRKKSARPDEEEEDLPPAKKAAASETADQRKIRLREEDQEEMHAFADRLKDRDDARTNKTSSLEDDKVGRELDAKDGDKQAAIEQLRVRSREDYLTKRESQKLQALADDIKDEDYLFSDLNITKRCVVRDSNSTHHSSCFI